MSYSLIVAALQDAGLLAANATEPQIAAALEHVYAQLALGLRATGIGMNSSQIATAIGNNTLRQSSHLNQASSWITASGS